jgi:tetratricopeptide (TPR) repeat protein
MTLHHRRIARRSHVASRLTRAVLVVSATLGAALGVHSSVWAAPPTSTTSTTSTEVASVRDVLENLEAWDDAAAADAAARVPEGSRRALARGLLAHQNADYTAAETEFSAALAAGDLSDDDTKLAEHYLTLSRGSITALAQNLVERSSDGRFVAVFAAPSDTILAPYLFEAMGLAYDRLGAALDVFPDHAVRFEIFDDAASLSLATPLSLDAVYTTGTVGLCKYRRVMQLTPRVMLMGYGWIDTAVHEYVHYLVSIRTRNRAPVWLQEGLAKLYETRWRLDAPPPLDPPLAKLLHEALTKDDLVTLEEMHPSIAMLPTPERAALAYAEVQTMLELVWEEKGDAGILAVLDAVAAGADPKTALAEAAGSDFDTFYARWKRVQLERTRDAEGGPLDTPRFAQGGADANDPSEDPTLRGSVFSHLGGGRARQHARLGVLLTLRGHREAAVLQYEKARASKREVADDPELSRRLGQLYLQLERANEALPLLRRAAREDPEDPNLAADEGRALRLAGRVDEARAALWRAVAQNPFIPRLHCDLAELAPDEATAARERALCRE